MSSLKRLAVGSLAGWAKIGISLLIQLALVPLFLSRWDQEMYGVWLAIQAAISLMAVLDFGHQNYIGNEFLRVGFEDRLAVNRILGSAIPIGISLGSFQLCVVAILVGTGALGLVLGPDTPKDLQRVAAIVLLLQSINWALFGSVAGLLLRVVVPFGYYPRFAWWGVLAASVAGFAPAIAVIGGCGLFGAGVALFIATAIVNVPMCYDLFRIMRKERLVPGPFDCRVGIRNFLRSQILTLTTLCETLRQQGARLILSPLAGAADMAAFSTMRTGANVALQGLGTIANPLLPELMRFLNSRDQSRCEGAFGLVWFLVIGVMAPAVVTLQMFAKPLFEVWTQGKMVFDPNLFSLLSVTVLVYALAQPALAVVRGNNLLQPQLAIGIVAAAIAVSGMGVLVPSMGILGAAVGLLVAEVVAMGGAVFFAASWMGRNGLRWPTRQFVIVGGSVTAAACAMFGIVHFPVQDFVWVAVALIIFAISGTVYWQSLPEIARQRMSELVVGQLKRWRCVRA